MSEILFSSLDAKLHGEYHHINKARSVALVLPPHPKFGATMNNKVVVELYNTFVKNNFSTLKINYSGVGCSEGEVSAKDTDLVKDANASIEWLQANHPLVDFFWIAGFSSGAWLALNLVMRRPEISAFIAVSPPLKMHDFSFFMPCTVPGLIIHGSNDHLSSINDMAKLTNFVSKRVEHFKLEVIQGADYKMNTKENLKDISDITNSYLLSIQSHIKESVPAQDFGQGDPHEILIPSEENELEDA